MTCFGLDVWKELRRSAVLGAFRFKPWQQEYDPTAAEKKNAANHEVAASTGRWPNMATAPKVAPTQTAGLTLKQYAGATKLPAEFLSKIGVHEILVEKVPTVAMRYFDFAGNEDGIRLRNGLNQEARWRKPSKTGLYGAWKLREFRGKDYIVLTLDETDAQTLWFHDVPAVGIPGEWHEEWAKLLIGFAHILIAVNMNTGIPQWLRESEIRTKVMLVRLNTVSNISQLYLGKETRFSTALNNKMKRAQPWAEYEQAERERAVEQLLSTCKEIAQSKDVLTDFTEALKKTGITGEDRNAQIIYLSFTSRLLGRPVSIGVKGPSAGGKSWLVDRTAGFFPDEAFYKLTAMSDRALAYSDESLEHRVVYLAEASGISGDFQEYLVRSLLSEGQLTYETVEKGDDGKFHSRRIVRKGPTGLIVTTTAVKLHAENETRFFSIRINDTPEQTTKILVAEARKVSGNAASGSGANDLEKWRAYQQWLAMAARPVTVPFAPALAELIPPVGVRLRRDFNAVLSLVQAHALLHARNREIRSGQIVATLKDYERVRSLIRATLMEGVERGVSRKLRETVAAVKAIRGELGGVGVSVFAIANKLNVDRSTAQRRVKECIERDLLQAVEEPKRGRRLLVDLGEELPENQEILPTAEEIEAKMNRH